MRVWLTGLVSCLLLVACDPDPAPKCEEAYDHLITLAKRPPESAQRQRFLQACHEAYDESRHRCFLDAVTVEDALACRPGKVRPG